MGSGEALDGTTAPEALPGGEKDGGSMDDSDDECEDDDDDGGGLLFLYTNLLYAFYKSRKTSFFYNILGDAKMNALKALAAVAFITCCFSLGSFIFSFFETWSFVDGFYFCFITMTTIGFGDIVPGNFISF